MPTVSCKFIFVVSKIFPCHNAPSLNKLAIKSRLKLINWPLKKNRIITCIISNFSRYDLANLNQRRISPPCLVVIFKFYLVLLLQSWRIIYFEKRNFWSRVFSNWVVWFSFSFNLTLTLSSYQILIFVSLWVRSTLSNLYITGIGR